MSGYIARHYVTNKNRHWWGIAFRLMLINSGKYVKTSNPNAPRIVGEDGPELVKRKEATS